MKTIRLSITTVISLAAFGLFGCSSSQNVSRLDYYGFHNNPDASATTAPPRTAASSVRDQGTSYYSDAATDANAELLDQSTNGENLALEQPNQQVIINNYYSAGYTPVITPWWNSYNSAWSIPQSCQSFGVYSSPWTSWRSWYTPTYNVPFFAWGSNWYAPWYSCNPYYGFGFDPYYSYNYGFCHNPWFVPTQPPISVPGGTASHDVARQWGVSRSAYGARESVIPLVVNDAGGRSRTTTNSQEQTTRIIKAVKPSSNTTGSQNDGRERGVSVSSINETTNSTTLEPQTIIRQTRVQYVHRSKSSPNLNSEIPTDSRNSQLDIGPSRTRQTRTSEQTTFQGAATEIGPQGSVVKSTLAPAQSGQGRASVIPAVSPSPTTPSNTKPESSGSGGRRR